VRRFLGGKHRDLVDRTLDRMARSEKVVGTRNGDRALNSRIAPWWLALSAGSSQRLWGIQGGGQLPQPIARGICTLPRWSQLTWEKLGSRSFVSRCHEGKYEMVTGRRLDSGGPGYASVSARRNICNSPSRDNFSSWRTPKVKKMDWNRRTRTDCGSGSGINFTFMYKIV